jgi:pimeloyl-ACP methyl ester carboxylesterase
VTTDFREPVRSSVPTLIFAGRRDPVTPPWTAHAVAKTLTRGRVLTWAAGGHAFDGLKTRTCKEAIVRQFVTTGRTDDLPVDCMSREAAWPLGN